MAKTALKLTIPKPIPTVVTRDDITRLLFETHKKCANSAEEVMTLKEIAKINDLYPKLNDKLIVDLSSVVKTMGELQSMNDAKLLEMIGEENLFDMPPLEGTFKELKETDELEARDEEVRYEEKQEQEEARHRRQMLIEDGTEDER